MASPRIIVQKYGGSSVADPPRLRRVAEQVAQAVRGGFQVVVVVSAMGKTTDDLLALARKVAREPPRRDLDMLLSTGERISMALLAMALWELGVPAISFTGSQSGILTNDRHSGARIIEVRPVRIQDELERDHVVIVAGFQGMSYKREITTLGRGGSDTTAVALAAALGAEACEIYSDVDGVYSADPRVVPEAHHLPEISYEEMQELAEAGAKVLNAQAVQWARRAGIVIHARATAGPLHNPRETRVVQGPAQGAQPGDDDRPRATAVTGTPHVVVLRSRSHAGALLRVLGEEGVTLRHCQLSPGPGGSLDESASALQATFTCEDLPDFGRTAAALQRAVPAGSGDSGLVLDQSQGTVTAVGAGRFGHPATLLPLLAELRERGLTPLSSESGPLRLCLWLPSAQVAEATRALHDRLCRQ